MVQGHVDGMGRIAKRERQGDWETIWFSCSPGLARAMVPKGSITVDGVSLTLVEVSRRPLQRRPDPAHPRRDDARHEAGRTRR